MEQIWETVSSWLVTEGVKLLFAIIGLFICFKVINFVSRKIEKKIKNSKKHVDETISSVLISIIRKVLKFIVLVSFLGYVGIETSSIAAAITSAGLAIGLALQGSLANFAGGVIILIMRPYKIGDYIDAEGESGTVEEIKLFYTVLTTVDNKVVTIPNGKMADTAITNYSTKKTRRLDMKFDIAYENDVDVAKQAILTSVENFKKYKNEPAPFVNVDSYKDSSVCIVLKVWVDSSEYWNMYYYIQEEVRRQFANNNIEIPFNQLDVHLDK
jgi:small conductance mechanosensitive channel